MRLPSDSLSLCAVVAGLALFPCLANAQSTACSESQAVLWSQLPERNWAATQSLLDEIESIDEDTEDNTITLTPALQLSIDPVAANLLDAVDAANDSQATPEAPAICFTNLDPSCVRDPGSSTTTTIPSFERGNAVEELAAVKAQPRTNVRCFPGTTDGVGPDGVRSSLERPPQR